MRLKVIGTGSSGNCYALIADEGILLLDAGLPIRTILRSLPEFREKPIQACLITHEHGDHAKSAYEVARLGIPVYGSAGTAKAIVAEGGWKRFYVMEMRKTYCVGDFTVMPFETQHDAEEPCGYLIRHRLTGETLVYATDTYYIKYTFPRVNYWVVECNYVDEAVPEQLLSGEITKPLRDRLARSHMSLRRLLDALKANDLSQTRCIVLVHLSDERSDERRMVKEVRAVSGVGSVVAARQGMNIKLELCPF